MRSLQRAVCRHVVPTSAAHILPLSKTSTRVSLLLARPRARAHGPSPVRPPVTADDPASACRQMVGDSSSPFDLSTDRTSDVPSLHRRSGLYRPYPPALPSPLPTASPCRQRDLSRARAPSTQKDPFGRLSTSASLSLRPRSGSQRSSPSALAPGYTVPTRCGLTPPPASPSDAASRFLQLSTTRGHYPRFQVHPIPLEM